MKRETSLSLVAALVAASLAFSACGGGGGATSSGTGGKSGGDGSGGTNGGGTCAGTMVTANEANNYMFQSTLSFPPVKVKAMSDLTFDWSAVTKDFENHAVNLGTDINTALILLVSLSLDDFQTALNTDMIPQRAVIGGLPLSIHPTGGQTSAKLSDFTLNGSPPPDGILTYFDPTNPLYPSATTTYAFMVATGTTLGRGTRMIQTFQPDTGSTNTTVNATTTSTHLEFTANLHSLTPTLVTAGQAAIKLDWGKMKTNALGNDFDIGSITDASVGHYTQAPADLEGQNFLDLNMIATEFYTGVPDNGTVVDLSTLKDSSGKAFSGINGNGTWIVALQCGGCRNPAPWYLTVLKPCN